jgi:hypothetical protein
MHSRRPGLDTPPVTSWTPQRSLDDMDQCGEATSILSAQTPGIGFLWPKEAAAMAPVSNEYAKTLVADYPGRFGTFALLPMAPCGRECAQTGAALARDVRGGTLGARASRPLSWW